MIAYGITLSSNNKIAFVVEFYIGLKAIDIDNIRNPIIIGNIDISCQAYKVTLSKTNIAYVGCILGSL